MSMIRKAAATFAALALSAGLVFDSALWGAAASQVEVTYKVPFFQDIVKKVQADTVPEELFITDVRGEMFGMPDHALVADGLSVTWYKDPSYTQPYGFDEALSADLTLYGKIGESSRNFLSNGFGWDVRSGKIYDGDAINDNYITSNEYTSPSFTDEETGAASFAFSGIKYSVYGRGLDVTKPFTVDLDFTNVVADNTTAWFLYSLFPALTLAQAGVQGPWANAGAGSVVMFNLGNGGAPQPITKGMDLVGYRSSTETSFTNNGADFKALFANGNRVSLVTEITDEGTTFSSGGKVVANSPAKRSDFPSGYAYISLASNGSPAQSIDFDVKVSQEAGNLTASADSHAKIGELKVNEMAVTLSVTVDEGYEIESVTADGISVAFVKLYGKENEYALDVPVWGKDAELKVNTKKEGGEPASSGCGSNIGTGAGIAALSVAALFAAAACIRSKTK